MNIYLLGDREDREPDPARRFTNGWTAQRERPFPYYWLVHDENGVQIDRDKYFNDVLCRYQLKEVA